MGCTRGELLDRMSSEELTRWMAFESKYGILGPQRGDYQAALVASTIARAMGDGKTDFSLEDFLLQWGEQRRPVQSGEEQLRIFQGLAAQMKKKGGE